MDDDDVQETGVLGGEAAAPSNQPPTHNEVPPPQPPRPITEQQKNVLMLKEAFPGVDEVVIRAVLSAGGGRIDPAFNALLGSFAPAMPLAMPPTTSGLPARPDRFPQR